MAFDVEMERDVLATALRDLAFASTAVGVLEGHSFSSKENAWIWRTLADLVTRNRELPTGRIWAAKIEADWPKPEAKAVIKGTLKALISREVAAPRSALDSVREYVRLSSLRRSIMDGADGLDRGDVAAAEEAIAAGLLDARAAQALRLPVRVDGWRARVAGYSGEGAGPGLRFETPLPTLNRALGGGLPIGGFALVLAQTNVGKSTFMTSVGWAALALPEAHIIHVTTEEPENEAMARWDARASKYDREKLLAGALTAFEREVFARRMEKAEPLLSRIHVHEMEPGSPVGALWPALDGIRGDLPPGAPILFLLDSPDHLAPPAYAARMDNRLRVAAVYWTIRALAKDPKAGPLAAWAVTWAPAEYEKKRMTANATAESKEKGRIATFMVGLSEGEATEGEDETEIAVDVLKNRHGRLKGLRVITAARLGIAEFREVDRAEGEGE